MLRNLDSEIVPNLTWCEYQACISILSMLFKLCVTIRFQALLRLGLSCWRAHTAVYQILRYRITSESKRGKAASYLQQAVCVRRKKKKTRKNPAASKTHHKIHSSPVNTTTSRRHATKHVPRVSPYSPASIDPGFVEIGLVQLSQSAKTTNVTHTQTDRQTN